MHTTHTLLLMLCGLLAHGQQRTYCNPINIDYGYTPFEQFSVNGKHRATADPVIVNFRDTLFLFSTNQEGYWYSASMLDWTFVYRKFLLDDKYEHDLNAPAVWAMKDSLYVYGSTWDLDFPIWKSGNPTQDEWEIAVDTLNVGAWDPAFLYEEAQHKLYLYRGSSNEYPVLGTELHLPELQTTGITRPIMRLHPDEHGWERFGEYNDNVFLNPFVEGAWVTKHDGKYYFQYAAPGTEFSGYADGVLVSDHPLDGFRYQRHNPFSYKPGGFARGAGHGATFQDRFGQYWHVSTLVIAVKNNFERRREAMAVESAHAFRALQNEYSLLERAPETDGTLQACKELDVAFIPYFPLKSGLLTGKYRKGQDAPEGSRLSGVKGSRFKESGEKLLTSENLTQVEALIGYAEGQGHEVLDLAFAYLLAHPAVASVIAGATKPAQIEGNVRAAGWQLSAEEVQAVAGVLEQPVG